MARCIGLWHDGLPTRPGTVTLSHNLLPEVTLRIREVDGGLYSQPRRSLGRLFCPLRS